MVHKLTKNLGNAVETIWLLVWCSKFSPLRALTFSQKLNHHLNLTDILQFKIGATPTYKIINLLSEGIKKICELKYFIKRIGKGAKWNILLLRLFPVYLLFEYFTHDCRHCNCLLYSVMIAGSFFVQFLFPTYVTRSLFSLFNATLWRRTKNTT